MANVDLQKLKKVLEGSAVLCAAAECFTGLCVKNLRVSVHIVEGAIANGEVRDREYVAKYFTQVANEYDADTESLYSELARLTLAGNYDQEDAAEQTFARELGFEREACAETCAAAQDQVKAIAAELAAAKKELAELKARRFGVFYHSFPTCQEWERSICAPGQYTREEAERRAAELEGRSVTGLEYRAQEL